MKLIILKVMHCFKGRSELLSTHLLNQDDDVKAYLASESEDEDYTDERAIAEKYKSLLLGNSEGKNDVDKMQEAASDARRHAYGTKSKDKGDLHVTLSTGIDEIGTCRVC
jgi:hypothetical protein